MPYGISVTCHPPELIFPSLTQPIKADTWFSQLRRMQSWVDFVGLFTYQSGLPTQKIVTHPSTNLAQHLSLAVLIQNFGSLGSSGREHYLRVIRASFLLLLLISQQHENVVWMKPVQSRNDGIFLLLHVYNRNSQMYTWLYLAPLICFLCLYWKRAETTHFTSASFPGLPG